MLGSRKHRHSTHRQAGTRTSHDRQVQLRELIADSSMSNILTDLSLICGVEAKAGHPRHVSFQWMRLSDQLHDLAGSDEAVQISAEDED